MGAFSKQKSLLSLVLIAGINFLFAYKYLHRITQWALAISCAYFLLFLLIVYFLTKNDYRFIRTTSVFVASMVMYSIAAFILWSAIDINQLHVDRWSVISSFWQWAGEGKYPYLAISHMGNHPGPLPVYFLITWPFLKFGELGIFTLAGFIILSSFLYFRSTIQNANTSLFILITSVAVVWELITRSTIFTNAVLFLLSMHWFLVIDFKDKKHLILSALIAAMLLSTRTIFLIPLVIFGIYKLKLSRNNFKNLFTWSLFILLFFALTFVPFMIYYPDVFWQINPFTVQSEQLLPIYIAPILILLSVFFGWKSKKSIDVIFFSGFGFILTFIIYFIYVATMTSLYDAFFMSAADISYLLFSLPFFLYSFNLENKTAR
ncbi:MAG: hypothetical protein KQH79_03320 [Bacteroidetes bacterium]|nr:hypothetical protein [Bacteroidota bacterium]